MTDDPIARVRRFNRAVTATVGALDTSFLGRGRPLGAARLLWSIQAEGSDVVGLRAALKIDSGLLSRLLRGLEGEGLVITETAPHDRRHRVARLTPAGAAEKAEYDRLNDQLASKILRQAAPNQDQLLAAMDLISNTLTTGQTTITPVDPEDPAARTCLAAYFALLAERIPGITSSHVPIPDPDAHQYRPPHGAFLLALCDGQPLACVSLKTHEGRTGEVKRLWVAPTARGQGLARRMMAAIETEARNLGLTRLILDTNSALVEAITLYRATGWRDTAPYTTFPADCWFEKAL